MLLTLSTKLSSSKYKLVTENSVSNYRCYEVKVEVGWQPLGFEPRAWLLA